ncbi:uncharacterized protein LOC124812175 isoform X2 [Hydra vulgaris]|uniref:uncharacterized protein LOC124812175 isoform X2 n=1 Tax=Hydra vulgaris TaxID=6087 RepID=UPI001F5E7473|nr:uncharacterized protein LOC124812175 isoform X1 [Hydra vulgaris]
MCTHECNSLMDVGQYLQDQHDWETPMDVDQCFQQTDKGFADFNFSPNCFNISVSVSLKSNANLNEKIHCLTKKIEIIQANVKKPNIDLILKMCTHECNSPMDVDQYLQDQHDWETPMDVDQCFQQTDEGFADFNFSPNCFNISVSVSLKSNANLNEKIHYLTKKIEIIQANVKKPNIDLILKMCTHECNSPMDVDQYLQDQHDWETPMDVDQCFQQTDKGFADFNFSPNCFNISVSVSLKSNANLNEKIHYLTKKIEIIQANVKKPNIDLILKMCTHECNSPMDVDQYLQDQHDWETPMDVDQCFQQTDEGFADFNFSPNCFNISVSVSLKSNANLNEKIHYLTKKIEIIQANVKKPNIDLILKMCTHECNSPMDVDQYLQDQHDWETPMDVDQCFQQTDKGFADFNFSPNCFNISVSVSLKSNANLNEKIHYLTKKIEIIQANVKKPNIDLILKMCTHECNSPMDVDQYLQDQHDWETPMDVDQCFQQTDKGFADFNFSPNCFNISVSVSLKSNANLNEKIHYLTKKIEIIQANVKKPNIDLILKMCTHECNSPMDVDQYLQDQHDWETPMDVDQCFQQTDKGFADFNFSPNCFNISVSVSLKSNANLNEKIHYLTKKIEIIQANVKKPNIDLILKMCTHECNSPMDVDQYLQDQHDWETPMDVDQCFQQTDKGFADFNFSPNCFNISVSVSLKSNANLNEKIHYLTKKIEIIQANVKKPNIDLIHKNVYT